MRKHKRGPATGVTVHRFSDIAPSSYDADSRTVECVISVGGAVQRSYGIEQLRISSGAVDLSRMQSVGIPTLDSPRPTGYRQRRWSLRSHLVWPQRGQARSAWPDQLQ